MFSMNNFLYAFTCASVDFLKNSRQKLKVFSPGMILFYYVVVSLLLGFVEGANEKYKGNQLIKISTETIQDMAKMTQFMENHKASTVEVWNRDESHCQVQFTARGAALLKDFCSHENISYTVIIPDVKQAIDRELQLNDAVTVPVSIFSYSKFNRFQAITEELFRLERQFSFLMKVISIGRSHENRPLFLVKISECLNGCDVDEFEVEKPIIWIDGGTHSREWISVAALLVMMRELMIRYQMGDVELRDLLKHNTFYFIPVLNPDGYEYSFTDDRMWRKTRTNFTISTRCSRMDGEINETAFGADANRNWDIMWGGVGASPDPCNETFRGIHCESEPCVKAFANILRWKGPLLKSFWTLHSFQQLILAPNSYTSTLPHDINDIRRVAITFVKALRKRFGTFYNIVNSPALGTPITGAAIDYVHDILQKTFAFALELRPRGEPGFLLDPSQIKPTALETLDGILASLKDIDMILKTKQKQKND